MKRLPTSEQIWPRRQPPLEQLKSCNWSKKDILVHIALTSIKILLKVVIQCKAILLLNMMEYLVRYSIPQKDISYNLKIIFLNDWYITALWMINGSDFKVILCNGQDGVVWFYWLSKTGGSELVVLGILQLTVKQHFRWTLCNIF